MLFENKMMSSVSPVHYPHHHHHHHSHHQQQQQQQQQQLYLHHERPSQTKGTIKAIKSKFEADIVRFSISSLELPIGYEHFRALLAARHSIGPDLKFDVFYTDPNDNDLLPITNDTNLGWALQTSKTLLRIYIQRIGGPLDLVRYDDLKPRNLVTGLFRSIERKSGKYNSANNRCVSISNPVNFRQVSAIIDVDILPSTCRRVKILKHGSDRPLGFYIKDGESFRINSGGIQQVTGVFVSRIVPGGLAEATGLLAVNDEILEVNGIDVTGKTLDQVTDMMIANSSNLIMTVKPAVQHQQRHSRRNNDHRGSVQQQQQHRRSSLTPTTISDDEINDLTDSIGAIHRQDWPEDIVDLPIQHYSQSHPYLGHDYLDFLDC